MCVREIKRHRLDTSPISLAKKREKEQPTEKLFPPITEIL